MPSVGLKAAVGTGVNTGVGANVAVGNAAADWAVGDGVPGSEPIASVVAGTGVAVSGTVAGVGVNSISVAVAVGNAGVEVSVVGCFCVDVGVTVSGAVYG